MTTPTSSTAEAHAFLDALSIGLKPGGEAEMARRLKRIDPSIFRSTSAGSQTDPWASWITPASTSTPPPAPAPRPLPSVLLPVPTTDPALLLPASIRPYILNAADRLQVDPAAIAVPLFVSLGSVIGTRLGLRPLPDQVQTEFPNLWGAVVGHRATLNAPVLAALRPLCTLEATARLNHQHALQHWRQQRSLASVRFSAARSLVLSSLKKGLSVFPGDLPAEAPKETGPASSASPPQARAFITTDLTPATLHPLLSQPGNTSGMFIQADELAQFLNHLAHPWKTDSQALRTFLRPAWTGHQPALLHSGRTRTGHLRLERACVSVFGTLDPEHMPALAFPRRLPVRFGYQPLSDHENWLHRLSLLVWPDTPHRSTDASNAAGPSGESDPVAPLPHFLEDASFKTVLTHFEHALNIPVPSRPGAQEDPYSGDVFLTFTPDAVTLWRDWLSQEVPGLPPEQTGPAWIAHASHRKIVAGLALLFHLLSTPDEPQVSATSLFHALAWMEFLQAHHRRVQGLETYTTVVTANLILGHLRTGKIARDFKRYHITEKNWVGLNIVKIVEPALDMLVAHGWLTADTSSCPSYTAHPHIYR